MQPRITKGCFSRRKCNAEKKYKPLQFETFEVVSTTSEDQGLLPLLEKDVDLGEVNVDWFAKARKDGQEQCLEEAQRKVRYVSALEKKEK